MLTIKGIIQCVTLFAY